MENPSSNNEMFLCPFTNHFTSTKESRQRSKKTQTFFDKSYCAMHTEHNCRRAKKMMNVQPFFRRRVSFPRKVSLRDFFRLTIFYSSGFRSRFFGGPNNDARRI